MNFRCQKIEKTCIIAFSKNLMSKIKFADCIYWFNRQNTFLIIFILSLANFMSFTPCGGEEQYLAFAKQYMNPEWMPHSFTLNHPAGGNWAFQVIFGFLLRYFTFEQVAIWGRLLNFFLYAIPLALIFRKLKFTNIEVIFLLQLLFFPHQSIWAGEWVYKNVEEKTLAYIFVFWAIYFLLKDKPIHSSVFLAIATYFHFLVGGWIFLFVFVYFAIRNRSLRSIILNGGIYAILVLPLFIYLARTYFTYNPKIINGVNTDSIYAFFRLKNHIGMFGDLHYFVSNNLGSVLIVLAMFAICVFWFRKIKLGALQQLNMLNIIVFSQQFIFIGIGLFDKNGTFMKMYPFRTNTMSTFLFILEIGLVFRYYSNHKHFYQLTDEIRFLKKKTFRQKKLYYLNGLHSILFVLFLPVFVIELCQTINERNLTYGNIDPQMYSLMEYSKLNTPKESVFLFLDGDNPISFIRFAERERFVVEKYTPTMSRTIYEWHSRIICKQKLQKDISLIDSVKSIYRIDYLVSDSSLTYPSLKPEKSFGKHTIYKVY